MKYTDLPIQKILRNSLKNGGTYADIFFEKTDQTIIQADNNRIEKIVAGSDSGAGIRVVYGEKTAYGFTNEMSESTLLDLGNSVAAAVNAQVWEKEISFNKINPKIKFAVRTEPNKVSLEQKVAICRSSNDMAWKYDKSIQQASIVYKDVVRNFAIFNSIGEFVEDQKVDAAFMVIIIASNGKIIQTGHEAIGGFAGFEFFENNPHEKAVRQACERAISMLKARPAPTGPMPVVLSAEAGGTMVHEAVGHGLEADLALNGFSIYQNKMNESVASSLVSVIDDATLQGKRGSFSFDDEGTPSQKNILIENGILKSYMHNRVTAEKADCSPTGNGRRQSYRSRPVVRMTNTFIKPGKDDPSSILRETGSGLFVKKMGGGQVNTITGDFVFEVQEGYLIKNGRLSDPVRGATLTGNGPEVLSKIDRVGNDLGFGIGTCGKDGQGVPVGHAQPTLRIPEIVVGGTS